MSPINIALLGLCALSIIVALCDRSLRKRNVAFCLLPRMDTGYADRMWKLGQEFWATGHCGSCGGVHFDHSDDCELHAYLGGDAPTEWGAEEMK